MKQAVIAALLVACVSTMILAAGAGEVGSRQDDEFIVGNDVQPQTLDPHLISTVSEQRILSGLFEGLVTPHPETTRAMPGIAESWEVAEDRVTYTFALRDDARWSDGTAITAEQIVGSWIRILDPETASPAAWFPAMFIDGAAEFNAGEADSSQVALRAVDENTLQFETAGPRPYLIDALAHHSFQVVPLHAIEEYGRDWTLPENFVGNGPYVLTEWSSQDRIVLERNPAYWNAATVELERVAFRAGDDAALYDMYDRGEIDWATTVPSSRHGEARLRDDYHVSPHLGTYYYVLNNEQAPLDDPDVRRALAMAIDRPALLKAAAPGGQIAAYSLVPDLEGYRGVSGVRQDVAGAQSLLSEAGYPRGRGFPELTILYNSGETHHAIAQAVQAQWLNHLGIDVQLEAQAWGAYVSRWESGDFDIIRVGWIGDYPDPHTFLEMFLADDAMNGGNFSSERYGVLIADAARMERGPDRFAVLQEAEEILVEDQAAVIPIYHYVNRDLIDLQKWSGWYTNVMGWHPVGDIAP